ncbi:putative Ig domain-containing protein [Paracidovorax sp. MALMAid1276]|uniref:putative Ig domain-containing protein n=1 Tax=Paracidovorax sp. MALMAid1276 TaxID=3411631 RepID=UPI003B9D26CA
MLRLPGLSGRGFSLWAARVGAFMALALALGWSGRAAAQHTSTECPPQTATVTSGGSVTINISDCAYNIGFAGSGLVDGGSYGPPDFEDHGTGTLRITGGQWFLDYSHNGTSGIGGTDVFEFSDGSYYGDGDVRVTITITASASPITVTPGTLPALKAGTAFSQSLSSSGGLAPYTYALQSGVLPVGLSLSAGGVLSGTPTQRGGYSFSVRSTDATTPTPQHTDKGYTGTVANPTLTLTTPSGTAGQGVPFSQTLATSGGVAPYIYQIETGSLPAGISLSGSGVVSGTTAAAPGNYPVTLRVTDSSAGPGVYFELENYTLTVSTLPTLSITDVSANEGNAGTTNFVFTVNLSAPAGAGGVSFDIATADGTAVAGVDYVARSLTGQTIAAGSSSYIFTVQVQGDTLREPNETFFVNVTNVSGAIVADGQGMGTIVNDDPLPSLSINDVSVVEGNAGTTAAVFTVTLSPASGETVTVNYATANGTAAQPGDYTAASGTLTFTPGQTALTITVLVNGDTQPEANETFFVNLSGATNATMADNQGVGTITNDDVPVSVSPGGLPGAAVAAAYSQAVSGSGGSGSYTFAVTAGSLPAGLTLAPGGLLSGTPTAGGTFHFTITATDTSAAPGPYTGSQAYTLLVGPPTLGLAPASLPGGTRTVAYSATLAASGGTAPYSYAVTAGSLPGGLALSGGGALTGTPTVAGSFNFSITATDSSTGTGPYTTTTAYTVAVAEATPVASNSAHTVAHNSSANTVPLSLSGGPPSALAITTPAVHGTATVSGTTITYTPHAGYAGPDSFAYTATNGAGTSAPATVSITVSAPTIVATPAGADTATVGTAFSRTYTWSGGAAPYTGMQVLNLPVGLSVTATTATTATVSGTPTTAGVFNLALSATDSSTGTGPFSGGANVALTVAAPTVAITPVTLPDAPAHTAYSQALAATGGIAPHSFAVTAGALPPGLTLSAAGVLSGTPGGAGSHSFTVTATDHSGNTYTGSQAYTLQVVASRTYTGASPAGGGAITASFTGGGAACVFASAQFIPLAGHAASPPAGSAPQGVQFLHGLFDFATTGCTPGSTLQFTVTYPSALPGAAQYWKYGPTAGNATPHWYTVPSTVAGAAISFSIADGGLGDDDLAANGTVVDAGGAGFGAGSGTIGVPVGDGLPLWLTLAVLGAAAWQRGRAARGRR